jgi:hypothetical protein
METVNEIKYFSPDGRKTVPNGHYIQKAGFIKECVENSKKFKTENYQFLIREDFEIVEEIHGNGIINDVVTKFKAIAKDF